MPARTAKPAADPGNAKGELIAACRTLGLPDPVFQSESDGPGHAPWFRTTVLLGERELGRGEGRSKRDAERAASLEALRSLAAPGADADAIASAPPTEAYPSGPVPISPVSISPVPIHPVPIHPVPIYAELLSQALLVAHERIEDGTLTQVAHDAALLYRRLLAELGHLPEERHLPEEQ